MSPKSSVSLHQTDLVSPILMTEARTNCHQEAKVRSTLLNSKSSHVKISTSENLSPQKVPENRKYHQKLKKQVQVPNIINKIIKNTGNEKKPESEKKITLQFLLDEAKKKFIQNSENSQNSIKASSLTNSNSLSPSKKKKQKGKSQETDFHLKDYALDIKMTTCTKINNNQGNKRNPSSSDTSKSVKTQTQNLPNHRKNSSSNSKMNDAFSGNSQIYAGAGFDKTPLTDSLPIPSFAIKSMSLSSSPPKNASTLQKSLENLDSNNVISQQKSKELFELLQNQNFQAKQTSKKDLDLKNCDQLSSDLLKILKIT
jgi:hypothetical protein